MKFHWPTARQHSLIPILVLLLAILAFVFDRQISEHFVYQRELIAHGQWWRLITGHFFHTNGMHLLLNSGALILLWGLHGQYYRKANQLILYLVAAAFTSIGIYFSNPELIEYVGLSGILHGIFVWGAVQDIIHKDKTGWLLLIGVSLKLVHEQIYGASSDVVNLIDSSVAVDAHLWGAICGLLIALVSVTTKNKS